MKIRILSGWAVILLILCSISLIISCASPKTQALKDFSHLNGQWVHFCDSVLTGNLKGKIECVMAEGSATRMLLNMTGTSGKLIFYEENMYPDTAHVKLEMTGDKVFMITSGQKRNWKREVIKYTSQKIELYYESKEYIILWERPGSR